MDSWPTRWLVEVSAQDVLDRSASHLAMSKLNDRAPPRLLRSKQVSCRSFASKYAFSQRNSPLTIRSPTPFRCTFIGRCLSRCHYLVSIPQPSQLDPVLPRAMQYIFPSNNLDDPNPSPSIVFTEDAGVKETDTVRRRCFNCCASSTNTWRRSVLYPGKVVSPAFRVPYAALTIPHSCATDAVSLNAPMQSPGQHRLTGENVNRLRHRPKVPVDAKAEKPLIRACRHHCLP
jgi:hypothetical protein